MQGWSARRSRRVSGKIRNAISVTAAFAACAAIDGDARADAAPTTDRASTVAVAAAQQDRVAEARAPVWLEETAREPAVMVFPPRDSAAPRPIAVMLHGMCDPPERECPYFAGSVTEFAWLVCPRARLRCSGGGTMWDWRRKAETIDAAVERVRSYGGEDVDADGDRILIGFSLGALAAMDIAHGAKGQWPKLVLIGAEVFPNATLLKRAGVKRVILASGERDMMRWHMTRQAALLDRRGVPATYMSLGPVGHWFATDMDSWMRGAVAWLESDEPGSGVPAGERHARAGAKP